MKKLFLSAFFVLVPAAASAQCSGVFAANTVCGRTAIEAPGSPHQISVGNVTPLIIGTTIISPSGSGVLTSASGILGRATTVVSSVLTTSSGGDISFDTVLPGGLTIPTPLLTGNVSIATNGGRVSITNTPTILSPVSALVHIENNGTTYSTGNSLRIVSKWTGTTASPYTNNDSVLSEVYNDVQSNSSNRSWAYSGSNSRNKIPLGISDGGTRLGVYGWAVSTNVGDGYVHNGTLAQQVGVQGTAGFLGTGSGSSAVITEAYGGLSTIVNDSTGSTITRAIGHYVNASGYTGVVQDNTALRMRASGGTISNLAIDIVAGIVSDSDTTDSTSTTTGSMQLAGGLGVAKSINANAININGVAVIPGSTLTIGTTVVSPSGNSVLLNNGNLAQATAVNSAVLVTTSGGTILFDTILPTGLAATSMSLTGAVLNSTSTLNAATYPTIAQGSLLYGSATNAVSALAKDTNATRYLSNTGTSNNPAWAQVNMSNGVTSVLGVTNGGTGNSTSYVLGDIAYANGTSSLTGLADVATGNAVISGGVGAVPSYGKIGLTTHVSGTLGYANGGTNDTGTAWTTYTPTVTCDGVAGTPTLTASGKYKQLLGKALALSVDVNITVLSTCTGNLRATFPFTAEAAGNTAMAGINQTGNTSTPSIVLAGDNRVYFLFAVGPAANHYEASGIVPIQ